MVYTYYIIMENIEKNSSQVPKHLLKALEGVTQFSLIQALAGRRSRRFCMGAEIPVAFMYMQAHHLDFGFYDHYFKPGSYLPTHAEHMNN
jgi:hypothetical protein